LDVCRVDVADHMSLRDIDAIDAALRDFADVVSVLRADAFGVKQQTVSGIVRGVRWRPVLALARQIEGGEGEA